MKLTLGFSPCPNDTFIFDALVNKKINISPFDFSFVINDVENLNKRAFESELDITKISFHAYAYVADQYQILDSGSALGYKNGPLLISKRKIYPDEIQNISIAIPGKYTTANLLLNIAFPSVKEKKEYLFSDIEDVVLSEETDAGLLIHENRFTYANRGLKLIMDLGELWEKENHSPIPLGCIIIRRSLPEKVKSGVNSLIRQSIIHSHRNKKEAMPFIKKHAANMDEQVMMRHIDLYVNDFTLDIGKAGREAVSILYKKAGKSGVIPSLPANMFINP